MGKWRREAPTTGLVALPRPSTTVSRRRPPHGFATGRIKWPGQTAFRLAVAFNSVSTVSDGFNVFSCTFNRVAGRQDQQRSTDGENCKKLYHFLRSEEHTSELQSLMRISYAVF